MQPDDDSMGNPRAPRAADADPAQVERHQLRRRSDRDIEALVTEVRHARLETRVLAVIVIAAIFLFGALIRAESARRADQFCKTAEARELEAVQSLTRTYQYLEQLTPAQRRESINQGVIAFLPETERQARTSRAPAYCYEPGLGDDLPRPVIPRRPKDLG